MISLCSLTSDVCELFSPFPVFIGNT
jgi:hypothetical protein